MKKSDLLIGTIFIFLLGSLFHFTYDLSSQSNIVALFSATNESVFEHTKLVIYPIIIWYLIYYFKNKKITNKDYLFSSMIINILVSIITIPLLFYFYTNAFGIESLVIDLIIFLISIILGFYYANKFYNKKIKLPWIFITILILVIYYIFTFYPPNLPIFLT